MQSVSVKFTFLASLIVPVFFRDTFPASLIGRVSDQTSLPIIDVSHPQLVLERSETKRLSSICHLGSSPYSWSNPVALHRRAFRLVMTLAGMPFLALVALVMVGMVGVSMMATRLTLLSLLACLLVLPVSAAWA